MSTFFPGKYLCGEFMDMCKTKQDSGIQQSRLYPENLRFYEDLQVSEREEEPLSRLERLKNVEKPLLSWYHSRARSLPWRDDPKPYRVWISEIMLQQTRVEAVKPYFERFMNAFPDVKALAEADDDYLMKMWEGLGYYNRARNLKAAAVMVMEEFNSQIPAEKEELLKLPGIGSYTAGAISSIAYGIPNPAVDGNVLRVLSRLWGDTSDIKKASVKSAMEQEIAQVMPKDAASSYNQGLIEIGALVCIPGGEPKCRECPLESLCITKKKGLWKEIPVKSAPKPKKIEEKTILLIEWNGKTAIHKRPPKGLLASLYELPNAEGHLTKEAAEELVESWICQEQEEPESLAKRKERLLEKKDLHITAEPLGTAKHIFSHVQWDMVGYRVKISCKMGESAEKLTGNISENTHFFMVDKTELKKEYSVPSAFGAYIRLLG